MVMLSLPCASSPDPLSYLLILCVCHPIIMNQHGALSLFLDLPLPLKASISRPRRVPPPTRHPHHCQMVHIIHVLGLLSLEFQLCPRTPPHPHNASHLEKN